MNLVRLTFVVLVVSVLLTVLFWGPLWVGYGFIGGDLYPYFFPQKVFLADRLHAGEFPLWNNLTGFGYPVLGESQTAAAYPPHLVAYYFLSVNTAYNVEHLLHYAICFMGTWLFATRIGLRTSGALLTAVVFTYGWFPPRACLEWAILTGAWLPVSLWCVESWIQTRCWRYAIGLSLALGLQLLAGHFHLAFITQLMVVTYGAWRICVDSRDNLPTQGNSLERATGDKRLISVTENEKMGPMLPTAILSAERQGYFRRISNLLKKVSGTLEAPRKLEESEVPESSRHLFQQTPVLRRLASPGSVVLLLSIAAGFLLASVQLLPAWELKTRSLRATVGGDHEPSYGHLPPLYISQLFAPWLWYSPHRIDGDDSLRNVAEWGAPWHWFGPDRDVDESLMQSRTGGLTTIATNKVEAHLYCGLVPLMLGLWWLFAGRTNHTLLSGGRQRFGSSKGTGSVSNADPEGLRPSLKNEKLFWVICGLAALVYSTGWLLPVARYIPGFNFFRGPGRYGIVTTLALAVLAGRGLVQLIENRPTAGRFVLIGCVFWSTICDLWLVSRMVTYAVMVSQPAVAFRDESPIRQMLINGNPAVRLYAPGQNVCNLLGVSCLPVYLGIAPSEYSDPKFAGQGMPKPTDDQRPVLADDEFSSWLRDSGVTHILSFYALDGPSWRADLVWQGIDPMLNRAGPKRTTVSVQTAGSDGNVLDRVPGFEPPAFKITLPFQQDANQRHFEVQSPEEITPVLRELAYPGWEVTIDERLSPASRISAVDPALGKFRAVDVPKGDHRVVWSYRPRSVKIGLAISLLTLFVLAAVGHLRFWHPAMVDRILSSALSHQRT